MADRFLPASPPFLLDHLNVPVAWTRPRIGSRAEDGGHARRDDKGWRRLTLHDGTIDRLRIVGTIGHYQTDRTLDLIQQGIDHREIADRVRHQLGGQDLAAVGIDCRMQLSRTTLQKLMIE